MASWDPLAFFGVGIQPQYQDIWDKHYNKLTEESLTLHQIEALAYLNPLGLGLGSGSGASGTLPEWVEHLLKNMKKDKDEEKIDKGNVAKENGSIQGQNCIVRSRNRCSGEIHPKYTEDGSFPKEFNKPKSLQDFKNMDTYTIDKILSDYKLSSSVDDGQALFRSYAIQSKELLGEESSSGGFGRSPFYRRPGPPTFPFIPPFMNSMPGGWGPMQDTQLYVKDAKLRRLLGYLGCDVEEVTTIRQGPGGNYGIGLENGFGAQCSLRDLHRGGFV